MVAIEVAVKKFVADFPDVICADRFAALRATGVALEVRVIDEDTAHHRPPSRPSRGIDDMKDAIQLRALLTVSSKEPPPVCTNQRRIIAQVPSHSALGARREAGMAEREGFEPPIRLPVCRISSAVLSTTQPPLQAIDRTREPELFQDG